MTAISYDAACCDRAIAYAKQFNLKVDSLVLPRLHMQSSGLWLYTSDFSPIQIDFNTKTTRCAKKFGVVRACKPNVDVNILDLTAGFGEDAALLSSFRANVLMLERNAMMAALLQDGLERKTNPMCNLRLLHIDASDYLATLEPRDHPDIIYYDPMHPIRQKSALVKKEMQILQQLLGFDTSVVVLLKLALKCAKKRVVVKWPQRLAPLVAPNYSIDGTTVRFDVYCTFSSVS